MRVAPSRNAPSQILHQVPTDPTLRPDEQAEFLTVDGGLEHAFIGLADRHRGGDAEGPDETLEEVAQRFRGGFQVNGLLHGRSSSGNRIGAAFSGERSQEQRRCGQ